MQLKTEIHLLKMFGVLDTDGSGKVSFDEWHTHYSAFGITPEHARASFDAIDQDGDGQISMDEFVSYHLEYYYTTDNKLNSALFYGPPD